MSKVKIRQKQSLMSLSLNLNPNRHKILNQMILALYLHIIKQDQHFMFGSDP